MLLRPGMPVAPSRGTQRAAGRPCEGWPTLMSRFFIDRPILCMGYRNHPDAGRRPRHPVPAHRPVSGHRAPCGLDHGLLSGRARRWRARPMSPGRRTSSACSKPRLPNFGGVEILLNAAGINSGTPFFEIEEAECSVSSTWICAASSWLARCSARPWLTRQRRVHHQHFFGVFRPSAIQGVHLFGGEGRRQSDHQVSGARICSVPGARECYSAGFFPAEQNRKLLTEERVASIMNHTPMRRYGAPSELIGAAVYLASDKASSFVTGSIVRVDGGFGAMTI